MCCRVDATDDDLILLSVPRDPTGIPVSEIGEDSNDILGALKRNFTPLVAEALAHRHPERGGIDAVYATLAGLRLAVGHNPNVGRDPRVIEKLLRKRDQRLEQVILQDEAANFAFATPGIPCEQRRAIHDDRDARAALLGLFGVREHVQKEEKLAVTDARKPWCESPCCTPLVLSSHGVFVTLPILSVRRIRDQVVERLAGMAIVRERAAIGDIVRIAPGRVFYEEIGLGDSPCLRIYFLAEQVDLRLWIDGLTQYLSVLTQPARNLLLCNQY